MDGETRSLRGIFDQDAQLYDAARPGYPEELIDDVVALSGIVPGGRILEIGCGTGQATLPFARRGYRMLCVELGESLAAVARHKLSGFPVEVRTGAFEEWPVDPQAFDLAISATAFHWLDPTIAYPKAAQSLKPGGAIALFWNLHVQHEMRAGFFEEAQRVYERETPEIAGEWGSGCPYANEVPADRVGEIEATGLFGEVTVRRYRWDAEYDAASYIDVLNTYSGHRNLEDSRRQRLFDGIAGLIDGRYGGRIVKAYLAILYVAQIARPHNPI